MAKEIIMEHGLHNNRIRLFLKFAYDQKIGALVKTIYGAKWSQSKKAWHVPYHVETPDKLKLFFTEHSVQLNYINEFMELPRLQSTNPGSTEALPELSIIHTEKIKLFVNWMRSRRYSESTVSAYLEALKTFLRFYSEKPVEEISNEDLIAFNNAYILKNKLSSSFQNQLVNAVKLFYKAVELRKMDVELIYRPKREHVLPNVLSKEEIRAILNAHSNIKHKAMLSLIYSCGLRRSELLNLKLSDIDSKRGLVIIRKAKGKKDRVAPLSDKMLMLLRDYFVACRPKEWLFEGQSGRGQYDERSLANVLKQALEKSKITKPVSLHWLRHSYATHLLENGTDLRYIQEILGHSRSRTTEIYTHVSNQSIRKVISPFDNL